MCVYVHKNDDGSLGGILCVHIDDTIYCGSGLSFSTALTTLRRCFPFRKCQIGEGIFCGSNYVQNKATKEIMITQTEFAAKTVKIPCLLRERR